MKDSNFIIAIKILNELKINYWVCHGTLLGIVRDKELLDWDNDIDIAVIEDEVNKNKIISEFLSNGFELKKKYFENDGLLTFTKNGSKEVDINFYQLSSDKLKVSTYWSIPKNVICKIIDVLANAKNYRGRFYKIINKLKFLQSMFANVKKFLIKKDMFYLAIGYQHPYEFIRTKSKILFSNIELSIPKKPKEYLETIYGKDWMIPNKDFIWYKDSPALAKKINEK